MQGNHTALYRKFRPDTFDKVKGQDAITTTLKNQVLFNRISHAYLFCGTRGTGKTSLAKIFARAVNCKNPINGSPCNECEVCKGISSGKLLNVIEIDAASNNGVDSIRELCEEVKYSPTEGKYRVYIIDEVHMLTNGAFNALLKTLEEPPSYVIFILATTELNKVPATIQSRCQKFMFNRISLKEISDNLSEVLAQENIFSEKSALDYIAKVADGSMRDALSLLEQCIMNELSYENVLKMLGAVDTGILSNFFNAINKKDIKNALSIANDIIFSGKNVSHFCDDFIGYLRNMALLKLCPILEIEVSNEGKQVLLEETKSISTKKLLNLIREISALQLKIKHETQKSITLEVGIINLCTSITECDFDVLLSANSSQPIALDETGNVIPANNKNASQLMDINSFISYFTKL